MHSSEIGSLIVEDKRIIRRRIKRLLGQIGKELDIDLSIHEAENGGLALKTAVEKAPRLILMDINMPDVDGLTATKQIREQGIEATVIIVSSSSATADKRKAQRSGASGYIVKAANQATFKAFLKTAVEMARDGRDEWIELEEKPETGELRRRW